MSKEGPLVSIIIPTYNRIKYIGDTLDSILESTYRNFECIIVDDGSSDKTEDLLNSYIKKDNRIKFYNRPSNRPKGANSCRNFGFEISQGEYIQWFDSDDLFNSEKLSKQIKSLLNTQSKISLCNFRMFLNSIENTDDLEAELQNNGRSTFLSYIAGRSLINMQISLIHRSIAEQFTFDESLHQSQDLDFMYRVLKSHYNEVSILNEVLCYIRKHSDTITSRFRRGKSFELSSDIKVRDKIFNEQYKNLDNGPIKSGLLHRTLYSYRSLLVHGHINQYLSKMFGIMKHISIVKRIKILVLVLVAGFYLLTKRGMYIYGKLMRHI